MSYKKVKLTELRKELQYLLDEVYFTGQELMVFKGKKPWVSIRPLSEGEKKAHDKD